MKKLVSIFAAAVMILTMLSAAAGAVSVDEVSCGSDVRIPNGPCALRDHPQPVELPYGKPEPSAIRLFSVRSSANEIDRLLTLEALIKDALLNGETRVDVAHLNIMPDEMNLYAVMDFSPYFSGGVSMTPYYYADSCYSYIVLTNNLSIDETAEYFAKVDKKIAEVREVMSKGKTDLDLALILHDYLVYNAAYDYENYLNNTIPEESYRSAGVLMNRTGVCQSYAYAYMYLLTLEGVECYVTSSEAMNHAWNIVNIDGEFYQTDVTWDDPVPDSIGKVRHRYFLKSDAAFIKGDSENNMSPHYGWDESSPKCTSTLYDDAYWNVIGSTVVAYGDSSYYVKDRKIVKKNNTTGTESEFVSLGKWPVWGGGATWSGEYSGLVLIGDALYYNTNTEIRKVNLATLEDSRVLAPDISKGYVYGSVVYGDELTYFIATEPLSDGEYHTVKINVTSDTAKVTLNEASLSLTAGESFKLIPSGVTSGLKWTVKDAKIATVSADGVVTAVSEGSTTVSVTAPNGTTAECAVKVSHAHVFSEWTVITEATCTDEGLRTRKCSICSLTEKEKPSALGHETVKHGGRLPTCLIGGWEPYETCTRCSYTTYKAIAATGHIEVVTPGREPTCTERGYTDGIICASCGVFLMSPTSVSPKGHTFGEWIVVTPPSEYDEGVREHTCSDCGFTESAIIPTEDHVHFYYLENTTLPTCTEKGFTEHYCKCGEMYTDSYVEPKGHELEVFDVVPSTCTSRGEELFFCKNCNYQETSYLSILDHTEATVSAKEPTCTKEGYTESIICSVCNTQIVPAEVLAALGHDFEEDWTLDREPTYDEEGIKSRHCTRCDETTDEIVIEKLVKIVDSAQMFTDLEVKSWSKDGIDYVVSYGYMNGTGNGTTFDQTGTMTRAMLVSVLWRMAEKPSPEADNPFTDLEENQTWYHAAVIWAYENGIVTGTGKTTFAPTGAVTREQMATFLYRYAGYMGYDTEAKAELSVFPDEAKVGSWAYDALAWANAEGLITGAKGSDGVTRLDPQGMATREQVATILMRFCSTVAK